MFRDIHKKTISQQLQEPVIENTRLHPELIGSFFLPIIFVALEGLYRHYGELALNQQADNLHCGVRPHMEKVAKICQGIHDEESLINDRIKLWLVTLTISLLALGWLAKRTYNKLANPSNRQIAYKFYSENPVYPTDRSEVTIIDCPLSRGKSERPVCLSYDYKGKHIQHAYDYVELIKWFKMEEGIRDPLTNLDLCGPAITHFKLNFDVPKDVPERNFTPSLTQ